MSKGPGEDALWQTFGLSYASWLTLPRVMMHAMPDIWQGRMSKLIDEFHRTFLWPEEIENLHVSCRVNGRIAKLPDWLAYRHSPPEAMDRFRRSKKEIEMMQAVERPWREVLGFSEDDTVTSREVQRRFDELRAETHSVDLESAFNAARLELCYEMDQSDWGK